MATSDSNKHKGIIGTIIYHGIILLILLLGSFSVPVSIPGDQGILINFGDSEKGLGNLEPAFAEPQAAQRVEKSNPAEEENLSGTEEDIMTQDFEEAPVIASKEVKKKKVPEKDLNREVKPDAKVTPEKVTPKVNTKALYSGKNTETTQSGPQGITEGEGNQGKPEGSIESDSYIGDGLGTTGVGFDLTGRSGVFLPPPPKNYQRAGIVVVEILVDQDGNVVNVREGVKGSTTSDITLLKLAKEAALKSKFSSKNDAPVHQKGTITYSFKIR